MRKHGLIFTAAIVALYPPFSFAQPLSETYTSKTLFVVPWDGAQGGFQLVVPTQPADSSFIPPIKGPRFFEVDLQGNVYIGTNAQRPPEVRKYTPEGRLLWKVQGAMERDFNRLSLEERIFAEIGSMCCDNDGNLYIAESGDYHGDKIAKYDVSGRFAGFMRTGFDCVWIRKRDSHGGIVCWGRRAEDPPDSFHHPFQFQNGMVTLKPEGDGPKDREGRTYSHGLTGHLMNKEAYTDSFSSPSVEALRGSKRHIILTREVSRPIDQFWKWKYDHVRGIKYRHEIGGYHLHASDKDGNFFVTVGINDPSMPLERTRRMLKIDPLKGTLLAEMILIPGELTRNLEGHMPVIVPETSEVYDFLDLQDGLHVVKYSRRN